jgi:hypothetical protein
MALLVVASVGTRLLGQGGKQAVALWRRVALRRHGRWELSRVSATVSLLQQDLSLYD